MESVKMNITFMGEPNEDNEITAGEIISLNVPISQVEKINKNIDDNDMEALDETFSKIVDINGNIHNLNFEEVYEFEFTM
jgi:hypothetical protein